MRGPHLLLAVGWLFFSPALLVRGDETADQLGVISRTGPNGAGSAAAQGARDRLAQRGIEIFPQLLAAMDTANPVAANWYRSVYEEILARERARPQPNLPRELLRETIRDPRKQGKLRRLVLELLDQLEPEFGKQLLPTLLDDPEFRIDAVNLAMKRGDDALAAGQKDAARTAYRSAFVHSRLPAQVRAAAGKMKSVGEAADVIAHLGMIVHWYLIGPFDAPGTSGFKKVFPPEEKIDLQAEYAGQEGKKLRWQVYHNADPAGELDLTKAIGPATEAVAYGYAELLLEPSRPVPTAEVRYGADDNCTVWINGVKVFGREQWLNSSRTDRFMAPVQLRSGRNTLLVKICQGPRHVDPTIPNNWSLQIRICDPGGAGLGMKTELPKR